MKSNLTKETFFAIGEEGDSYAIIIIPPGKKDLTRVITESLLDLLPPVNIEATSMYDLSEKAKKSSTGLLLQVDNNNLAFITEEYEPLLITDSTKELEFNIELYANNEYGLGPRTFVLTKLNVFRCK